MSNLNAKFKEFLENLEQNIKNKEDLDYIKVQIFNLYNMFFDKMNKTGDITSSKLETLIENQVILQEKIEAIGTDIKSMKKELYTNEDDSFMITCPYCNKEFIIESNELENEVQCPKCKNIIKLDWEDEYQHNYLNYKNDEDEDM